MINTPWFLYLLWIPASLLLESLVIVVERLVHYSILVCGLYEGLALEVDNPASALDVGIDECGDFETGTKFVFETERVVPWSLVRSKHNVLASDGRIVLDIHRHRSRRPQSHFQALGGWHCSGNTGSAGIMVSRSRGDLRMQCQQTHEVVKSCPRSTPAPQKGHGNHSRIHPRLLVEVDPMVGDIIGSAVREGL